MPNHASAKKHMRADEKKRLKNRYQHKTARTFIKKLLKITDKQEAETKLKKAVSMLDKLAKSAIIHPNKSARKKAQLTRYTHSLA